VVPDILLLGKALGGGMPLGAFIADKKLMDQLTDNPVLGHITTFGGHPVCCAAGKAAFEVLLENDFAVKQKETLFLTLLRSAGIGSIKSLGLWMAVKFENFETCKKTIESCIQEGVLADWFLFVPNCLRISPPLTISDTEIKKASKIISEAFE